jgi:hypothetical protein
MPFAIVDQDGLMLGDRSGPFVFLSVAEAHKSARHAEQRIGGRFKYHVERYEAHGRMRDEIEVPPATSPDVPVGSTSANLPNGATDVVSLDAFRASRGSPPSGAPTNE